MNTHPKIAIVGVGRLGGALALALSEKGYEVCQLVSRGGERARKIAESIAAPAAEILTDEEHEKISAGVVFITTPDSEIQIVDVKLARNLKHKPLVIHTSGALSSNVLQNLRRIGCPVASLHPLVSISDSQLGARRFKGAFFCVEGEPEAAGFARQAVEDLEGKSFSIGAEYKALYHASAVMASGHLVALFSSAVEALSACGVEQGQAQEILLPLLASTVENLSAQSPARALTGTFSRADVETLKKHLRVLTQNVSPEILAIYLQLGMRSVRLAEEQGAADEAKLSEMRSVLLGNSEE